MINFFKPSKKIIAICTLISILMIIFIYLFPPTVMCIPSPEGPTGLEKFSLTGREDGCRTTLGGLIFEYTFDFAYLFLLCYIIILIIKLIKYVGYKIYSRK